MGTKLGAWMTHMPYPQRRQTANRGIERYNFRALRLRNAMDRVLVVQSSRKVSVLVSHGR